MNFKLCTAKKKKYKKKKKKKKKKQNKSVGWGWLGVVQKEVDKTGSGKVKLQKIAAGVLTF